MMKLTITFVLLLASQCHAATIYLCRAYNGSTFWAKAHCNQHNALIERIENVANVPWDQQVEQARAGRNNASSSTSHQQSATQTAQRCASLANELHDIESRYSKGQWQPVEIVNRDQKRQRAVRAELSRNHCPIQ